MSTPTTDDEVNEDWIKTLSWDLGFDTLGALFRYLSVDDLGPAQQRPALVGFMALPAWQAAPEQLNQEALAWLRETSLG